VDVFEILAQPIRLRIIEILSSGEHTSGVLCDVISLEFGVGRSATLNHLRLLKLHGYVYNRDEWPEVFNNLDEAFFGELETRIEHWKYRWERRIGSNVRTDPLQYFSATRASQRGYRGYARDPDDVWREGRAGVV
jgi:DNA-binding transcriptional ArsR family regulator